MRRRYACSTVAMQQSRHKTHTVIQKHHTQSPSHSNLSYSLDLVRFIFLQHVSNRSPTPNRSVLTSSIFRLLPSSNAFPTPSNALLNAFVAPTAGLSTTVGACLASALATPTPLPCSMTSAGIAITASLAVSRSRSRWRAALRSPARTPSGWFA